MSTHPLPTLRPLALSLHLACLGAAGGALGLASAAHAQETTFDFAIPAGPLQGALTDFSAQSRINVSYTPDLIGSARRSPGVQGRHSAAQALFRLLGSNDLVAVRQGNGFTLEKAPERAPAEKSSDGTPQLAPVKVTARADLSGVTEGSGSYTTRSTSTATRLPLSLRETPQSISVITRQRIEDENLTRIETLLDRVPGLSVQNMGTSRYQIYSRGYAIDNYQIDGILTAFDVGTQNVPQSQSDLVIYDRVEVLRGAAGLLTGAGDPSGTINLVRKKPTAEFQGYVSAGLGSWDHYRLELDVAGPINEAGSLRGRFVGALDQGGTHIDFYRREKSVLYGVIEADLGDRTLLTAGVDYQRTRPRGTGGEGLPLFYTSGEQTRFSPSANAATRWSREEVDAYNTFLSLEHKLAKDWALKFSANHLYASRFFSGAEAAWGFPDKATGDGVRLYGGEGGATQRQTGFDLRIQGPFEGWGRKHDFVLGFNWSDYKNFHQPLVDSGGIEGRDVNIYQWGNRTAPPVTSGAKLFDLDDHQKQYGAYTALRLKPRDDLALIVGARVSTYRAESSFIFSDPALAAYNSITSQQKTGVVTPYAGVVYDIDGTHSVYASYTSIFKPQTVRDRSGAVLQPRTGDNYEIGLKSEFFGGRLNSAIALYQIRQNNLAEADPGQTVPATVPPEAAYRAVRGARTEGVDVELGGELRAGWQAGLSYSYSTTKDADGERIRTNFPRQMAKLWTSYRLPGDWNRLTLGGGANWQDRIYYSTTDWTLPDVILNGQQKAYTVVNLMARYDVNRQLSATLNLNNVFDRKYLQGIDTTFNTGVYAATRNAMLNLRYSF